MNQKGTIIKSAGKNSVVVAESGDKIDCIIGGKYRLEDLKSTNPVVVGDHVHFEMIAGTGKGRITDVLERKNYIIRRASNLSKTYQIIASNIDQLLLLITIREPETYTEFIDRYLVTAEAYSIPSVIIINKTDLYQETYLQKMNELIAVYSRIGYECIAISALLKTNIAAVRDIMKNKINLLSGISGVGKSTLINVLDETHNLRTKEISDYHKAGKHTTTFVEMFYMGFGAYVIDTPGIKGFGVIDMEKEPVSHYFPEIFKISGGCRYSNCRHINEPSCAVRNAVADGTISQSRYNSYLSLTEEQAQQSKYRR
jgi:ribosome biogenesis GTPase